MAGSKHKKIHEYENPKKKKKKCQVSKNQKPIIRLWVQLDIAHKINFSN